MNYVSILVSSISGREQIHYIRQRPTEWAVHMENLEKSSVLNLVIITSTNKAQTVVIRNREDYKQENDGFRGLL